MQTATATDENERSSEPAMLPNVLKGSLKRTWKVPAKPFSKHVSDFINTNKQATWDRKVDVRQDKKMMKEIEKEMKTKKSAQRKAENERLQARQKKKIEDQLRSSTVQVIKNSTKIKKWTAKARRQLTKMSPEMVQQLGGKHV